MIAYSSMTRRQKEIAQLYGVAYQLCCTVRETKRHRVFIHRLGKRYKERGRWKYLDADECVPTQWYFRAVILRRCPDGLMGNYTIAGEQYDAIKECAVHKKVEDAVADGEETLLRITAEQPAKKTVVPTVHNEIMGRIAQWESTGVRPVCGVF